jgi:hypothetical protein
VQYQSLRSIDGLTPQNEIDMQRQVAKIPKASGKQICTLTSPNSSRGGGGFGELTMAIQGSSTQKNYQQPPIFKQAKGANNIPYSDFFSPQLVSSPIIF